LRSVGIENVKPGSTIPIRIGENISGSDRMTYLSREDISVNGTSDVYIKVELEPVTYQLSLRYLNVPSYIVGSQAVVNFFAEIPATLTKPAQIIKQWKKQNFENMDVIDLPGLYLADPNGLDLRIQVQGYDDEIVKFDSNSFALGVGGTYRLDLNFRADDKKKGEDRFVYGTDRTVVGLYDNILARNLIIRVSELVASDTVSGQIFLPYDVVVKDASVATFTTVTGPITSTLGEAVELKFKGVAVGYNMPYTVTVTTGVGAARKSYSVSKTDYIPPDVQASSTIYELSVNWALEYEKIKAAGN